MLNSKFSLKQLIYTFECFDQRTVCTTRFGVITAVVLNIQVFRNVTCLVGEWSPTLTTITVLLSPQSSSPVSTL